LPFSNLSKYKSKSYTIGISVQFVSQRGDGGLFVFVFWICVGTPIGRRPGGWARRSRAVLQLCNTRCCVCDKKTTQDIVVIKMQHTISSSESRDLTQDIVMQFRNVVNISQ
jgi:hypothetical protein